MEARAQSDYRKYSNQELREMIRHFAVNTIINRTEKKKFEEILKLTGKAKTSMESKKQSKRSKSLRKHYKKQLVRIWLRYQEHKDELEKQLVRIWLRYQEHKDELDEYETLLDNIANGFYPLSYQKGDKTIIWNEWKRLTKDIKYNRFSKN